MANDTGGGQNQDSKLGRMSIAYRNALITKNDYSVNSEYYAGHPDALSTGDEQGKGETNTIGGKTDISKRDALITKNKYNFGKEYNSGNM